MSEPAVAPVIAGTDGSPPADRAIAWAADEAVLRRRPLHIVHVSERWMYDIPLFPAPGMRDSLSEEGLRILGRAKALALELRPALDVTTELVEETTAHALSDASAQAFEVVLGHRGLGGFASMLLGSTGLRVAAHAFGPVVIVRGETDRAAKGEIVAGTDLSEGSTEALDYAFDAASVRETRLRVIHAWELSATLLSAGYAIDVAEIEQATRWNLTQALAPLRKRHPDVEVTEVVAREHPVSALVDVSAGADLVVVGSHGRTGRSAIRLGSVGHGVVHHAHCPVAIVRPRS
jgi:nucleotide-binding universal stress UspA family protein